MKLVFSFVIIVIFLKSPTGLAAPCCAGSSAAPSLLSGDDKMQITIGGSQSTVIGDAPDSGTAIFRDGNNSDVTQTFEVDGAYLISDRFQAGMSVPVLSHSIQSDTISTSSTNLGDVRVDGAYEFLPEWNYSAWRPKGYIYLQGTIPFGTSVYNSTTEGDVDATGKGFYTLSLGSLFVKRWSKWDAFAIPEVHYSITRSFVQASGENLQVTPGFGGSLTVGGGFSPGGTAFRIGGRVEPIYEQSKTLVSSVSGTTQSGVQLTWDATLDASYMFNLDWSMIGSYTDQTLIGPAINSTLNRTFALAIQHRWER